MTAWVVAAERAYIASATGQAVATGGSPGDLPRARAAAGAVASRHLAVSTPRSFGLVIDDAASAEAAELSLAAHRTWVQPTDLRCAGAGAEQLAARIGGRQVSLAEALACDIVCVHAPITIGAALLRRGTHVNVLAAATLEPELGTVATILHEEPGLGQLAAGLIDGRQLDEITLFVIGTASIALAAVQGRIAPAHLP